RRNEGPEEGRHDPDVRLSDLVSEGREPAGDLGVPGSVIDERRVVGQPWLEEVRHGVLPDHRVAGEDQQTVETDPPVPAPRTVDEVVVRSDGQQDAEHFPATSRELHPRGELGRPRWRLFELTRGEPPGEG